MRLMGKFSAPCTRARRIRRCRRRRLPPPAVVGLDHDRSPPAAMRCPCPSLTSVLPSFSPLARARCSTTRVHNNTWPIKNFAAAVAFVLPPPCASAKDTPPCCTHIVCIERTWIIDPQRADHSPRRALVIAWNRADNHSPSRLLPPSSFPPPCFINSYL
ncbi:uncharacterized protein SCHCODRAFT_02117093 [Schizophyllum commune H4-8]|uniref:uncharacterized protein n=1 Tax=Schizophyllum commune (strain H4-8 / FGSC 9210) TaxID=578458 RepID=UPI00215F36CE|nr:uncharacterized protein SCHCODRAFT_02117093 [Schizophyllum commune H4-8]KAI5886244.1 hypothetical protein SCHCODRAFT_02117093 [Schizophyllum commune H4-8]